MINYKNIKGLHLEVTTKCNAMCSMCNRNYKGKTRENLIITELTLENCKKILIPSFLAQLEFISICGVYGEPIMATQLLEIIDYFYYCNPKVHINIYTNGGINNKSWWIKLAKSIKKGYVVFGIDGIGDIHSIHRKNTDYYKIIENAKYYINAGGKARWDFIVFKHNEHQIEEARKISKEVGFEIFQVKKTSRFLKKLYEKDKNLDSTFFEYGKHPIFSSDGKISSFLELPEKKEYKNESEEQLFNLIEKYGSLDRYFDQVEIDCAAVKTNGIFISAYGDVYPCCNIYQQIRYGDLHKVKDKNELNEYIMSKKYNLSTFNESIENIVNGQFFQELEKSWRIEKIGQGKPKVCCRTCGKNLDIHKKGHFRIDKRYI